MGGCGCVKGGALSTPPNTAKPPTPATTPPATAPPPHTHLHPHTPHTPAQIDAAGPGQQGPPSAGAASGRPLSPAPPARSKSLWGGASGRVGRGVRGEGGGRLRSPRAELAGPGTSHPTAAAPPPHPRIPAACSMCPCWRRGGPRQCWRTSHGTEPCSGVRGGRVGWCWLDGRRAGRQAGRQQWEAQQQQQRRDGRQGARARHPSSPPLAQHPALAAPPSPPERGTAKHALTRLSPHAHTAAARIP